MIPSAFSSSGAASPLKAIPFPPSPASSPASLPRSGEFAFSVAPASTSPGVSAIALTSVRPMRPPAPATISRMSDMELSPLSERYSDGKPHCQLRLRAVIPLDDDHVPGRMRRAQRDGVLIFGRVVAGERGRIIRKLEHDITRACLAFGVLELPAAHEKLRTEFAQRLGIRRHIGLVAIRVADIDVR